MYFILTKIFSGCFIVSLARILRLKFRP